MSVTRRGEASRRLRAERAARTSSLEVDQANLGAYALALLGFVVMAAFSVKARSPIEALGLTFQTGTVLLASPELMGPLGRLGYLRRPAQAIRARRRRVAQIGGVTLVIATVVLVARGLDGDIGGRDSLPGAVALALALLGYLAALALWSAWVVEGLLEGAADTQLRTALRRLDAGRATTVRWAIAATMFGFGTLLLYVGAYG